MKIKRNVFILIVFSLMISNVSSLRINEVELNPAGSDTGNEWIELYSLEEIDLEGYKFVNGDGGEVVLSGEFDGYFIYVFEKQWLDNSEEISLYKENELIDKTGTLNDAKNNDETWQYCKSWQFLIQSRGKRNSCEEEEEIKEKLDKETENIKNNENVTENLSYDYKNINELKVFDTINLGKALNNEESKEVTKKNIAIYGLIGFLIVIILLFFLKKMEYKNEFG